MHRRLSYLLLALLLVVSIAVVVGCGNDDEGTTETTEAVMEGTETTEAMMEGTETTESMGGTTMSGEEVFANNCATCHGANGEGGTGPALSGTTLTESDVETQVRQGGGGMPSFEGTLPEEEIAAVAQYVVSTFGE